MNHHLLAFALSQPWALRPETMAAYAAVLARRVAMKEGVLDLAARAPKAMEDEGREPAPPAHIAMSSRAGGGGSSSGGAIAVIAIRGTIVQRADQLPLCEGGTATEDISLALRMAMADTTVGQIILHQHSPGGSVYGVEELGDEIREMRKDKPIVGFISSLSASACYWIGSQCSELYVTPGGEAGSIGVWSAHQNIKAYLEKEGVDIKLISAGKFKVEGHPYDALGEEAEAFMQSRVNDYYAAFTEAVAKGRKVPVSQVREGMGQGRVLGAKDALAEGMVDGVLTFDALVKKMQRDAKSSTRSGRSASSGLRAGLLGATTEKGQSNGGRFKVGDRVRSTVDHMEGMQGMEGTIVEAQNGPYYAISFDHKTDDMKDPHKWLADDELEPADGSDEEGMAMKNAAARNREIDILAL